MTGGEIVAAIIIALFIGSIFYFGFKKTGPWGSLWSFLLIIFLGVLLTSAWAAPIGPVWWGAAWVDLLFFGLVFALLLAAASPSGSERRAYTSDVVTNEQEGEQSAAVAIGLYFWLTLLFLMVAIVIGVVV